MREPHIHTYILIYSIYIHINAQNTQIHSDGSLAFVHHHHRIIKSSNHRIIILITTIIITIITITITISISIITIIITIITITIITIIMIPTMLIICSLCFPSNLWSSLPRILTKQEPLDPAPESCASSRHPYGCKTSGQAMSGCFGAPKHGMTPVIGNAQPRT